MATRNFFDLLGDDEHEDPAQIVVRAIPEEVKPAAGDAKKPAAAAAKLRTKPVTTNEAGRDGQRGEYDGGRGGRGGRGGGRGGRGNYGDYREGGFGFLREEGSHRDRIYYNNDRSGSNNTRDADGFVDKPVRTGHGEGRSASSYDGGRGGGGRGRGRGGRGYGEGDYRSRRREFDELSGNPRNVTEKRDADPSLIQGSPKAAKEEDKPAAEGEAEKNPDILPKATAEEGAAEPVREEEDNEMSLEEYEKALEEKRKALEGEKAAERKVEVDKAFETMQLVDNKKRDEDFFIKLGQEKEKEKEKEKGKREAAEREEKSRKPVSINEFLKPAEGEKYYGPPSSRGRGGRGGRGERREGGGRGEREYNPNHGSFGGGRFGGEGRGAAAPKIEDQNQFPTLGGK